MSKQKLALQTLKSIEATAKTKSAFKFSRVRNLARLVSGLGFAFLLFDLSPVAAQTLAFTEGGIKTKAPRTTPYREQVQGTVFTKEVYQMKDGTQCDVYETETGKKFVLRLSKAGKYRRYYPKCLNR